MVAFQNTPDGFHVTDAAGDVIAKMGKGPNGEPLCQIFFDGKLAAALTTGSGGPAITMLDPEGNVRAIVARDKTGAAGVVGFDAEGKLVLAYNPAGEPIDIPTPKED